MQEHELPSMGFMLDQLNFVAQAAGELEGYTDKGDIRVTANLLVNLARRVEDVVVVLRDHLSCHDCDEEKEGG